MIAFHNAKNIMNNVRKIILLQLKLMLELFNIVCRDDLSLPKKLSYDDNLIILLFTIVNVENISMLALCSLEHLLGDRDRIFDLSKTENFLE